MQFNAWFDHLKSYSQQSGLVLQVFIVVFATLLLNFAARVLLNKLLVKLKRTPTPWDDSLVDALRSPLTVAIWILGISLAARVLQQHAQSVIFEAVETVRDIGIICCATWFLWSFVKSAERNFVEHRRNHCQRPDDARPPVSLGLR